MRSTAVRRPRRRQAPRRRPADIPLMAVLRCSPTEQVRRDLEGTSHRAFPRNPHREIRPRPLQEFRERQPQVCLERQSQVCLEHLRREIPGAPSPGTPAETIDDGPSALLTGRIQMVGYQSGEVRIDVFDGDHRSHAGKRPNLVRSTILSQPGAFELQVPVSAGQVWLEASNDENQDGRPGPQDPSGRYTRNPLELTEGGASGIVIELERNDPPPGGEGAEL